MPTRRALMGMAAMLPLVARADGLVPIIFTASPIIDNLPVYLAVERGIFARHGLAVKVVVGNGGTIPAVLVAGGAQIGTIPPTTLLQVDESGLDLVAVAACVATPHPSAVAMVVGAQSGVKTAADLRGRKVGVPGLNGTFHVLARAFLARNGLDDGSVTILEVPYPRMVDTLRGGGVDAVTAPRPYLDRLVEMQAGVVLAELVKGTVPDGSVTMLQATTRAWAAANPQLVSAFRASLEEAIALIATDPDGARAVIALYTKMPPEIVAGMPFSNYGWRIGPQGLSYWIEESLKQGMITTRPDAARLIAG